MTLTLSDVPRLRSVAAPAAAMRSRVLRLGVLTPHNPHDRRAFSGTVYYAVQALRRCHAIEVSVLGPHRPLARMDRLLRRRSPRLEPDMLDKTGGDFIGLDAVVGLVASPLLEAAQALTDVPLIHVTDATPGFLQEVYGRDISRAARECEARVLARCTAIYSSGMMANRAAGEFGLLGRTPRALPFGVNFDDLPSAFPAKSARDPLELLFVGGDWIRKGGDVALAAFDRLRAAGQAAHLTLVGGIPAEIRRRLERRTDVTMAGFLDKNRPAHLAQLKTLFGRAHLFVLPTQADCTPMVISEALAHGTPVLASDVGGIAEMIGAGAGRTLPLGTSDKVWSKAILEMTRNPMIYDMMVDGAVERTVSHLNWDKWASGIVQAAAETTLEQARVA